MLVEDASSPDLEIWASDPLLKALDDAGDETPTQIQAQTILALLEGHDLGLAQTGTGKQRFRAAAPDKIDIQKHSRNCWCLLPTRELAIQVSEAFSGMRENTSVDSMLFQFMEGRITAVSFASSSAVYMW